MASDQAFANLTKHGSNMLSCRLRLSSKFGQYFKKYCAPGGDDAAVSKRWGLANTFSGWWQGGSAEGLMIGAGVDERLIRGLSEEVQGFSGREVMKKTFRRIEDRVVDYISSRSATTSQ